MNNDDLLAKIKEDRGGIYLANIRANTLDDLRWLTLDYLGVMAVLTRGRECRSLNEMYRQFAAALQFPYYFGGNWNAFSDVMRDLDWLPGAHRLIIVTDAGDILGDGDRELQVDFGALITAAMPTHVPDATGYRPVSLLLCDDAARLESLQQRLAIDAPYLVVG